MDRRTFVKGAAAAGIGLTAAGRAAGRADAVNLALPSAALEHQAPRTPVEHLVVLMMENRSVDHYLGWLGAERDDFDGIQDASFVDAAGEVVPTEPWGARGRNDFHGRGHTDPGHSWTAGRVQRNGGACDGWLQPGSGNDEYALATYDAVDLPVWSQLARGWQTYDRWFCSLLGPTFPNRYYLHSAQSAGFKDNTVPPQAASNHPEWALGWDWPTIWTLLRQAGVDAASYYSNAPLLGLWGARHVDVMRHVSEFYAAAAAGTLPQVSFVEPWYLVPEGIANDDHPHADLRLGQAFLSDVVEAFTSSPCYQRGALVVTYDEWGGFWDHVDPPRLPDDRATDADPGGPDDFGQTGFRVPSTIVSPWTVGHRVDHSTYDHASILRFISDNWGLPYLTARHAGTTSIQRAFRKFHRYEPDVAFVPYEAPPQLVLEPAVDRVAPNDLFTLMESGWFDQFGIRTDWPFVDSFRDPAAIAPLLSG